MKALMGLLLLFVSGTVLAGDAIYTGFFSNKALDGYDTVAYFTEGKPVKGDSAYITEYKGADWYFSSKQNRELFVNNPDKYTPQYGGFCAWAVAVKNDRAPGEPLQWTIVKDSDNTPKLYLNYDKKIKQRWEQDISGFIAMGDKNWPALLAN